MKKPVSADTVNTQLAGAEKNIFILFASPHRDGFTATLLSAFTEALPKNVHIDYLCAFSSGIVPCVDCGMCKVRQGCVFDDIYDFDAKYRQADIIVVATPIYNLSVPAPLKNILDRTQHYYNARFGLGVRSVQKPKQAVLLITGGSEMQDGALYIEKMLGQIFSVMNTKITQKVFWLGTDNCSQEEKKNALGKAQAAAVNIL